MALSERRVKRGWMNLSVSRIIHDTHDTRTLILVDQETGRREFDYIPGQYLTFRFDNLSEKPVVRSYTMSSAPCDGDWSAVTVKEVDRGFVSRFLCRDIDTGAVLRARGPIGRFCYEPGQDQKVLTMIAAGSGVTPFLSIMKEYQATLGQEGCPDAMNLLVSFRSRADIIAGDTLRELAGVVGIRIAITLSREDASSEGYWQGRISEAMLEKFLGDCHGQTFMCCGPQEMMDLAKNFVLEKGIPASNWKQESFDS